MSATVVIIIIFAVVVGLTWVFGRWWSEHRKHPGTLRQKARGLWAYPGLHWSPPAYLTLQLVISLGAPIAALALFALLADAVSDQEAITRLDLSFDNSLHSHTSPVGVTIAKGVSFIGGPTAMAVLMIAGAVYLLVRREMLLLYGWLVAFIGGGGPGWGRQTVFPRGPPAVPPPLVPSPGFRFPPGQSLGALLRLGLPALLTSP